MDAAVMLGLVGIAMSAGGMAYDDALGLVEQVVAEHPDADWREAGSAVDVAAREAYLLLLHLDPRDLDSDLLREASEG